MAAKKKSAGKSGKKKKTAAKKTAGKQAAGKKTAKKKTAGKQAAGKKTAAKKAPARKKAAKKRTAAAGAPAKKSAKKKAAAARATPAKAASEKAAIEKPAPEQAPKPAERPAAQRTGGFSSLDVNMGHVFMLRPRAATSFRPDDFREARQLLRDESFGDAAEAARAVAEKALELTRQLAHPGGGGRGGSDKRRF